MLSFTSRNSHSLVSLILLLAGLAAFAQEKTRLDVAEATFSPETILMQPVAAFDHFNVKVSGPDLIHFKLVFAGDETIELSNIAPDGGLLPDGHYTFEIVAAPIIDSDIRAFMREVRQTNDQEMMDALRAELPAGKVQSGSFRILGGEIVMPDQEEVSAVVNKEGAENGSYNPDDVDAGNNAQVFATDLIVQGSTCTGFDCVNSENFGSDTLRLKENNLRIHFNDTSNSGSFPTNDWRIIANDNSNGGDNYLSIQDSDAGTTPFRVDAGAGNNALRIEAGGNIGVGTSNPAVEVHIADGDSPTLRLEQNGSSGFQAQTWDIAGNETNFFVRDVTNGSELPFKIIPGADDNALYINSNNNIGMGTASPSESLHIRGTDGDTALLIQETNGTDAVRPMLEVLNQAGPTEIRINSGSAPGDTADAWAIRVNNNGSTIFWDALNDGSEEMDLTEHGDLTVDGEMNATAFNVTSDKNVKEEFEVVNPLEVLDKIADMEITTWEYTFDNNNVRHMGPMAQDFQAAFGLGQYDTKINMTDSNGVTMAAIQGLNLKIAEKDGKIEALRNQNDELQERLQKLESIVNALQNK